MAYTRAMGRDFFYDLDNQTLWQRTPEVDHALAAAYFDHGFTFDTYVDQLRASYNAGDHPDPFVNSISAARDGVQELAAIQVSIVDAHLEDAEAIRLAFEDFGQGVLFDDRPPRPPGRHIHMMDGTPDTWVGYHRWHAFARAATHLGAPEDRWIHMDRCLALAWAIQSEADPDRTSPNNPGLPAERLAVLREAWMALNPRHLDWAFVNHRRAPSPEALQAGAPGDGRYARVQRLLGSAVGLARPFHDGHERFWEKPHADFLALPPIYGVPLIAAPGPNRGASSGLVRVLRGQQPGFPRMPLNRPPMAAPDIQFIEDWIDAGCPED